MVYGTGLGGLDHFPLDGEAASAAPPSQAQGTTATLDGQPCEVIFAGLTPGSVGLAQFNIRLPDRQFSGGFPLVITVGSAPSQPVTLQMR